MEEKSWSKKRLVEMIHNIDGSAIALLNRFTKKQLFRKYLKVIHDPNINEVNL